MSARGRPLFELPEDPVLPPGLIYTAGFLTDDEEVALLEGIRGLRFGEVRMRGVAARRRIVQFGWRYSFDGGRLEEGETLPPFLVGVRDRAAAASGLAPETLSEVLVTEYQPGATIGWHRDAPPFGVVVGLSLLSPCRFRLRRMVHDAWERAELHLEPRSLYVLDGPARSEWQHSIPAVEHLRYSITFRTLRRPRRATSGRSTFTPAAG